MSTITQSDSLNSLEDSLTSLLSDIHDLQIGEMPRLMNLKSAPVIDQWSYGLLPVCCLAGTVREHPILGNRTRIHTSQLVLIDPANGWARTWSRYYRLGAPERSATGSGSL